VAELGGWRRSAREHDCLGDSCLRWDAQYIRRPYLAAHHHFDERRDHELWVGREAREKSAKPILHSRNWNSGNLHFPVERMHQGAVSGDGEVPTELYVSPYHYSNLVAGIETFDGGAGLRSGGGGSQESCNE